MRTKNMLLGCAALLMTLTAGAQSQYFSRKLSEKTADKDLAFLVSFDRKGVNADFAKGEKISSTMPDTGLLLRGLIGFDGQSAFKPEPGEALKFPPKGNVDPHKGTLILWTAGLDYNPGDELTDGKKRGNICLAWLYFQNGSRYLDYRLYEFAENIYFDWWSSEPPSGSGRVRAPRKGIKKGQWHQIAVTWNDRKIAIYLNGKFITESSLPAKAAKTADLKAENNPESFIGIKAPFYDDKHKWSTGIDDFAIYDRVLSPLEIRNQYLRLLKEKGEEKIEAYSITLNGVNIGHEKKIDKLEAEFDFSSLSPAQEKLLKAGRLVMDYELKGPDGKSQKGSFTFGKATETRIFKGVDKPGKYTLVTRIGKDTVTKEIVRPDMPWVGCTYGDEDEVPALWKDFGLNDRTVTLWNRSYKFGDGPLPEQVLCYGKSLFEKVPKLLIDGKEPVWKAGPVKRENRWITFTGTGKLGKMTVRYSTRVEYDGMILLDWVISGRPEISDMKLQWTMSPANRQFLMTPWVYEGKSDVFTHPYPEAGSRVKMIWQVSEKKGGFAYTMEHDANWVYDPAKPCFYVNRKSGEARVEMINKKVVLPDDTPYRAIFIATPARPLPEKQRVLKYGDSRGGGGVGMINTGGDAGFSTIFTHNPDPEEFPLRNKNRVPNTGSVYGGIGLTAHEPAAVYLWKYWETPGSYSYNMGILKKIAPGKYQRMRYPSIATCTSTSVNDIFLWSQHNLYTHPLGDRIWQVYYDLCGDRLCRSKVHGCCFKDKFGREINRYAVLTTRELIRRTVAHAHKYGKTVMLHGQREYLPMIQGMADYWFPGEQYNVLLRRNPYGYTDEVSDDIYRSEFNKNVLGVGVLHLPALGQADVKYYKEPKYTESMLCMLLSHDVETIEAYALAVPVERVWDIMDKYKVQSPETVCRLYHEQKEILSSKPEVRVTYYRCPDGRYLLILANKNYRPSRTEIDVSRIAEGCFTAREEYKDKPVEVKDGKFTIFIPARSFRMVGFPPASYYPRRFGMDTAWPVWIGSSKCDTEFYHSKTEGCAKPGALVMKTGNTGGGCYLNHFPIRPGRTYTLSFMFKQSVPGNKVNLGVQARYGNKFTGANIFRKSMASDGTWQKFTLVCPIPATGKWGQSNDIMLTMGASGKNCTTLFDDFVIEEK